MKTGEVLNKKYRIEKLLGKGGTGSVYLCTNIELGNKWAMKHIPKEIMNDKTEAEVDILKKLYHISLPRVVDVFKDEQGLYIVESNIEGTTLDRLLKRQGSFALDRVVDWSLELCDILKYLHGIKPSPIIYRDLKPSNIILTQGNRLVLVDFGISKEFSRLHPKDTMLAGTSVYAAPEQLIKGGITDQRTDIYNLGATMYQLLHGRLPGPVPDDSIHSKNKAMGKINGIISKCMENKPEDRYQRAEDVRLELQALRNMIVVGGARQKLAYKLELALIVVMSIVSYAITVFGIILK
ncbi:MAG TPA: serine/threonine-protein kinase [Clostridia bacterium]|nr:serine/threonine-protein kinase [Clostridia bacterium]